MDIINSLAGNLILGKPPIFWGGLLVFTSFLVTGIASLLGQRGKIRLSLKTHQIMAITSIVFAMFHALLGILTSDKIFSILGGIVVFTSFFITGSLGVSTVKGGRFKVSMRTHKIMVYICYGLALMHAVYGMFLS